RALQAVPGVASASVNLATERAQVQVSAFVDAATLIDAIAGAGSYRARVLEVGATTDDAAAERREAERRRLFRDLVIAAALSLPVFVLEMGSHLIPAMHHLIADTIGTRTSWWLQFALT